MATLIAEITSSVNLQAVLHAYQQLGAEPVKEYANISRLMGARIYLFDAPVGTPLQPFLRVPGVSFAEPDEEHIYVLPCGMGHYLSPANEHGSLRETRPLGAGSMVLGNFLSATEGQRLSSLPAIMAMTGAQDAIGMSKKGGQGSVLVIIDSGIDGHFVPETQRAGGWSDDAGHPDPWTDEFGHGTLVARVAMAYAPNAKVFSAKPRPGSQGGVMKESVMSFLDAAIPIIQANPDLGFVVNNSWGTDGSILSAKPYWCTMIPSRLIEAIDRSGAALVVFAAGNGHRDQNGVPSIVCINSNPGAITVGALDQRGQPQYYSSRGPAQCYALAPLISAPTWGVLPWGSGYRDFQDQGGGTSSTAPQVSGALALIKADYPKATNLQLKAALAASAQRFFPQFLMPFDFATGFGMLRTNRALNTVPGVLLHPYAATLRAAQLASKVRVPAAAALI